MLDPKGKSYLYGEIPREEEQQDIIPEYDSQPYLYGEILDKAQWVEGAGDPPSQTFLYGEICARAEKIYYQGSSTSSAQTTVDGNIIKVDISPDYVYTKTQEVINGLNITGQINTKVEQAVSDLDYSDYKETGKFVVAVDQDHGQIAVQKSKIYKTDVQGLNTSLDELSSGITSVREDLSTEASLRSQADINLNTTISNEVLRATEKENQLEEAIDNEIERSLDAEALLQEQIDSLDPFPSGGENGQLLSIKNNRLYWADKDIFVAITYETPLSEISEAIRKGQLVIAYDQESGNTFFLEEEYARIATFSRTVEKITYRFYCTASGWSQSRSELTTSSFTNDSDYVNTDDLSGYALKSEIPTKNSELVNDREFITSGGAPVQSVNSKSGIVVLEPSDIGAIADPNEKISGQALVYNGEAWVAENVVFGSDVLIIPYGDENITLEELETALDSQKLVVVTDAVSPYSYTFDFFDDGTYVFTNENMQRVSLQFSDVPVWNTLSMPTATIASSDKLFISDASDNDRIKRSNISFGTSTTTFLTNKGTWATPSGAVTSVNTKTGAVTLSASDVGAQSSITASGILKGDGSGTVTAATAGTDYMTPTNVSDNYVPLSKSSGGSAVTITDSPSLNYSRFKIEASGSSKKSSIDLYIDKNASTQSLTLKAGSNTATFTNTSTTISNIVTPTANGDAANKQYVDTKITDPSTKDDGQVLMYDGEDWIASDISDYMNNPFSFSQIGIGSSNQEPLNHGTTVTDSNALSVIWRIAEGASNGFPQYIYGTVELANRSLEYCTFEFSKMDSDNTLIFNSDNYVLYITPSNGADSCYVIIGEKSSQEIFYCTCINQGASGSTTYAEAKAAYQSGKYLVGRQYWEAMDAGLDTAYQFMNLSNVSIDHYVSSSEYDYVFTFTSINSNFYLSVYTLDSDNGWSSTGGQLQVSLPE